ncbi:mucin-2-like [Lineus longissimus]|uniref:mucin-2-like n=1 Tax=Lineus longissimus TaxID=88925 RepID=UPI00315D680D
MHGDLYMGTLEVKIEIDGKMVSAPLFSQSGPQGVDWVLALVAIPVQNGTTYRIVFEATRGLTYLSDIALDDISVAPCGVVPTATPTTPRTTPTTPPTTPTTPPTTPTTPPTTPTTPPTTPTTPPTTPTTPPTTPTTPPTTPTTPPTTPTTPPTTPTTPPTTPTTPRTTPTTPSKTPSAIIPSDTTTIEDFDGNTKYAFDVQTTNFDVTRWRLRSGPTPSSGTGPDHDYSSTSRRGSYAYFEASSPTQNNVPAIMRSYAQFAGDEPRCLSFAYHMRGSGMGSLDVVLAVGGQPQAPLFSASGDNYGSDWNLANVLIPKQHASYTIEFIAKRHSWQSDIAVDAIRVSPCVAVPTTAPTTPSTTPTTPPTTPTTPPTTPTTPPTTPTTPPTTPTTPPTTPTTPPTTPTTPPTTPTTPPTTPTTPSKTPSAIIPSDTTTIEDFDGNTKYAFDVQTTNFDVTRWRLRSGPTPSSGTGPDHDYSSTSRRGSYAYFEASSPTQNNVPAIMRSYAQFAGDEPRCLSFAYHMRGSGMGSLDVVLAVGGQPQAPLFNASGDNYGSDWNLANVLIPKQHASYTIEFIAKRHSWQSDIAVDAIRVSPCVAVPTTAPTTPSTTPGTMPTTPSSTSTTSKPSGKKHVPAFAPRRRAILSQQLAIMISL